MDTLLIGHGEQESAGQSEQMVQEALNVLDARQRWILMATFGIGGYSPMSVKEIAEGLDLTSKAVSAWKCRAMTRFREVYMWKRSGGRALPAKRLRGVNGLKLKQALPRDTLRASVGHAQA